jgi:large subunit ribosomal protein L17
MRHLVGQKKLQRPTAHRMAMLKNMVMSLLEHERIKTTVPKAKAARPIAERMITLAKRGGVANQRLAGRTIANKTILNKVFTELKERYAERTGGYTRIIRLGFRQGDAAEMALLELVDRPEAEAEAAETDEKPAKKSKKGEAEEKAE